MAARCPDSPYSTIAKLSNYKWIISARGYANIVQSPGDEVWGMIYKLPPSDEASLDRYEGVPNSYVKEMIPVELAGGAQEDVLVYIDHLRTEDGTVKTEYIGRMTNGVKDAVDKGIPVEYFEKYFVKFLGPGVIPSSSS